MNARTNAATHVCTGARKRSYIADHRPQGWRVYHWDQRVQCYREGGIYRTRSHAHAAATGAQP